MPRRAIILTPKTYAELRQAVEATLILGQREIDRAKLETYWRTGALIDRHLAAEEHETGYGTDTMRRLARDLNYESSVLYRCLRFARIYPNFAARRNLLWGHYRVLIDVTDPAERRALELEADRKHWTTKVLEERVRALNAIDVTPAKDDASSAEPIELLTPRRGTPGLHQIVERPDGLGIDLGFKFYRELTPEQQKRLAKGDIVRLDESGVRKVEGATKADLFTYKATVRKVIDGDTLDIAVELAPGFTRDLKLRLRELDCAEMSTAAGRAAKAFVDGLIKPGDEVIVCTTKPDKYERYLADVFVSVTPLHRGYAGQASDVGSEVNSDGSPRRCAPRDDKLCNYFLNNALLEGGYAVRYDGGAKGEEWG